MITPLPQPPPDVPDPKEVSPSPSKLRWIIPSIITCVAIMAVAGLSKTQMRRAARTADRTEAINNIKQISMVLIEFDAEYGQFPDASTAAAVRDKTKTPLTLESASSNNLFRQCLPTVPSEKPFWAKTAISPRKPDDYFGTDETALAPGECGFAYIAGLSSKVDPGTPVVMTSLLPGQLKFDREAFEGQAVVLLADCSARVLPIETDGRVLMNGMDIFDPKQPFWKGKKPDVKWPE